VEENLILAGFVLLPVLLATGLYLFFVRRRIHRRADATWRHLLLGNALVLAFLGSLLLLTGEVYYRFLYDATDSFGLTKVTQRWFERHFHYNTATFRDSLPGYELEPPPGVRRITFVGDSFTAGHGVADVEDRFANRIRALRPQERINIFAKCGWDTGHQLAFLTPENLGAYKLDVVVLVYCLNDVSDIVPEWPRILERIYQGQQTGFFVQHSWLLNTWYFRWQAASDPDVADYYRFVSGAYEGTIWEQQKQRLRRLRDFIHARGGRLLVVTFPFLHALGPEYEYAPAHEKLDLLWRELDVPHLDLLSTYSGRKPDELTVNAFDAHPNEHAHAIAADAIQSFLERELGVESEGDLSPARGREPDPAE